MEIGRAATRESLGSTSAVREIAFELWIETKKGNVLPKSKRCQAIVLPVQQYGVSWRLVRQIKAIRINF